MLKDTLTAAEFEAVTENDRVLYVKKAGENGTSDSYVLHPSFVAERTALSSNNQTILKEKKAAADALKAYQELGLTADQIAELKKQKEEADAAKLTEEEKKKKAEDALKASHQKEIDRIVAERKQREDFLTRELRRNMIEARAKIAVEKAGVIEGGAEVLLPHLIAAMDMVEEGDGDTRSIVTRIIDPVTRQPRYVGSNYMTEDQLVDDLKQRPGFGGVFKASHAGGGGANPNKASGATGNVLKRSAFDQLDPLSQRKHIVDGGKVVD